MLLDWRPWVLAAAYVLAGRLGLALAVANSSLAAISPETGIAIAGLLLWGKRAWPAVFLGAFVLHLTASGRVPSSLAIAAGNALEAVLGAWLVERLGGSEAAMSSPVGLFRFALVALIAGLLGACAGVAALLAWGQAPAFATKAVLVTWWLGDAVGAVLTAPTILLWARWRRESMAASPLEAAAIVGLRFATVAAAFGSPRSDKAGPVLAWPALVWSALRLGAAPTATLVLGGAAWAAYCTGRGLGPLASADPSASPLGLQFYMLVGSITVLALAVETERRRETEEALRRSNVRIEERIAEHAHELRTPIAAIKGFAETLRRGAIEDERRRLPFVRTIEKHADRLSRLVDRLLQLSRVHAGRWVPEPRPVPLRRMIVDCLDDLAPVAQGKNLELRVDVPADLSAVADPEHVLIAIGNLLENAVKYNRKGGRVQVRAGRRNGSVHIEVHDTGPGIPAEELPLLFTRFYRGQGARGERGSGLGLAIVKSMADANGGRVWAESRQGVGSTFFLTLPADTESPPSTGCPDPTPEAGASEDPFPPSSDLVE